jgi:hypothetical protein
MRRAFFGLLVFGFSSHLAASDVRGVLKDTMQLLNPKNCVEKMKLIEQTLSALTPEEHLQELAQSRPEVLGKELWDFKLKVHEKLRVFYQDAKLERDCANAYRGALRSVRFLEDLVQEHQLRNNTENVAFPSSAWEDGNIHVRKHPQHKDFVLKKDVKSGDVILTRGNAYTSAAISSLGEFDTQFSHMSLVHVDEAGKVWTVEAHIEVGSFVRPLEDHIEDNNFRTMIFRFDNPEIAAKAAKYAFERVKKASDTKGNILYDFGFSMDDGGEKLFCSEVVSHAYEVASNKSVLLPIYESRLQIRKPSFVQDIGITADESFIPADIEIDPRFSIVAEWRDANRVNDIHEKDAILQAMFVWVDAHGYKMKQASSWNSFVYRNVAWPLRRVPFLKKYFKDKMPINMSRKLIGYFGVLESIAELMHKEVGPANKKAIEERGLPLLREEKFAVLEEFRLKDQASRKKKLHKMFRPVKPK